MELLHRHCEERSDEAIQLSCGGKAGLLRLARNDAQKSLPSLATAGFIEPAAFPAALRYATLTGWLEARTEPVGVRGAYMTSAVTWPTPEDVRPTARAAPLERSSTRPLMKGPRSLTVTTTLRPLWVTRSLVPNGSDRWAAVMSFSLKRWPEAVLLPDSLPQN